MDPVLPPLLIDLDGTLIDSEPWYKQTEVDVLAEFGISISVEEMEEFTGLTLPVWLRTLNERYGQSVDQQEFLKNYRPQMIEHVRSNIQMFEDARRFLSRINSARSILVTSSMDWYVDEVLLRFPEICEAIVGVVCEADVQSGKPDPEPYLLAAKRLEVNPNECWVFEDAVNGVKSGIAAGCKVFGVDRYCAKRLESASQVVITLDDVVF